MAYDFRAALKVDLEVPFADGLVVTLNLKRPAWHEAEAIRRRWNEYCTKSSLVFKKYGLDPGNVEDDKAPEGIREELEVLQDALLEYTVKDIDNYILSFDDKDEEGHAVLLKDGQPLLCELPNDWKKDLHEIFGDAAFNELWQRLARLCRPKNQTLELRNALAKNSVPVSVS